MTRLTFAGAIFLTMIAILPSRLSQSLNVPMITAQFFGGTSLLIIVGVMLDTMRQVETHLIQRHFDGFLRKGRIRGRSFDRASYARGEAAAGGTLMWLYVGIAVLVIAGVVIFLYGRWVKSRPVLLGPPGAAKGTQAELITRHFRIPVTTPCAIFPRDRD